jgi:hypothetical protein
MYTRKRIAFISTIRINKFNSELIQLRVTPFFFSKNKIDSRVKINIGNIACK